MAPTTRSTASTMSYAERHTAGPDVAATEPTGIEHPPPYTGPSTGSRRTADLTLGRLRAKHIDKR